MRQDPPFNMAYVTATHILEKLPSSTLVINNPFEVRNSPEKIFVTNFSHLMPKTLISRNIDAIKEFRKQFKDIIIKPLYGNGGQGVFHILPEDENLNSILWKNAGYKEVPTVEENIEELYNCEFTNRIMN